MGSRKKSNKTSLSSSGIENYPNCYVDCLSYIGDCKYDGLILGGYNTEECGWDGGDCSGLSTNPTVFTRVDFPSFIGDGKYDDLILGGYNTGTEECGWNGGDCSGPSTNPTVFINGVVDYPNCHVYFPSFIGDGTCDDLLLGGYNTDTEECGWNGGDCIWFFI